MNRVYRVIWNHVKHQYVVVSELARRRSKQTDRGNRSTVCPAALLAAIALTGSLTLSGISPAGAADTSLPEGGVVSKGQYLAFATTPNSSDTTTKEFNGQTYTYTKQTITDSQNHSYSFYVREGYTLSFEEGGRYTGNATYPHNQLQLITTKENGAEEGGLVLTYINDFDPNDVKNTHGQTLTNWDGSRYGGGVIGQIGNPVIDAPLNGNYYVMVDDAKQYLTSASGNKLQDGTGFVKFEDGDSSSYDPEKHEFTYTKGGQTWTVSGDHVYSLTEGGSGHLGFFLYKGDVYSNHIYGWNNEILQTGIGEDGKWYTYWGTEVVDPNQTIGEMTYQNFSEIMNHFDTNDAVLAGRDIASIKAEQDADATKPPTGSLQFWSAPQYDADGKAVENSSKQLFKINVSNTGGGVYGDAPSKAGDVKIHFSTLTPVYGSDGKITEYTDGGSFVIDGGSKVTASTSGEDSNSLTGLTINGTEYTIPDAEGTFAITAGDGKTITQDLGNSITVAGDDKNIRTSVGSDNKVHVTLQDDIDLNSATTNRSYVTNVDASTDTSVTNVGYVKQQITNVNQELTAKGFGIQAEIGGAVHKNLGEDIAVTGDRNVNTSAVNGEIRIALENRVVLGDESKDQKIVLNGNEGRANIGGVVIGSQTVKGNGIDAGNETGHYVTSLNNKEWNKDNIVSGRAATEDQLQAAMKDVADGAKAAHTVVTAEDKSAEGEAYTDGNIQINKKTDAETGQATYDVKLNNHVLLQNDGNKVELNGNEGTISATVKDGLLETGLLTKDMDFNKEGLTVANEVAGLTTDSTKIDGGTVTIKGLRDKTITLLGKEYGQKDRTEVNGGTITSTIDKYDVTSLGGFNGITKETHNFAVGDNGVTFTKEESRIGWDGLNWVDEKTTTSTNIDGKKITAGDVKVNGESGSTITGLSNLTTDYDGFGGGRAATEEQLKQVNTTANKGWNVAIGDKTENVAPGASVNLTSNDGNIVGTLTKAEKTGNLTIDASLNDDISLGEGTNKIELNGSNGTALISGVQIGKTENGKNYVSGLSNIEWNATDADKDVTAGGYKNSTKAATESQLQQAISGVNTNIDNKTFGLSADEGTKVDKKLGKSIKVAGGKNITTKADGNELTVDLDDHVVLGHKEKSYIDLDGTTGKISAKVKDSFSSESIDFNENGLTVSGESLGASNGTTNIKGDKIRTEDIFGNYTEIDGGSVRTETLNVYPDTDNELKFDGQGLNINSFNTNANVGKDGVSLSVDNGAGKNSSMKLTADNTTFSYSEGGATAATTTVIKGQQITAGKVVVNGEKDASTIMGLSNTTWNGTTDDKSRVATEGQLKAVSDVANTGWNLSTNGGEATQIKPGDTVDFSNADKNIAVSNDGKNVTVDLNDDITLGSIDNSFVTISGTKGTIQTTGDITVGSNPNNKNIVLHGDDQTITGLSNTTLDGADFAKSGRAATEEQLKSVSDTVDKGWNLVAGGQTSNITPGDTVTLKNTDGNVKVTTTADGEVSFDLNDTVKLADGNITLDGTNKSASIGNVTVDGAKGLVNIGGSIVLDGEANTASIGRVTVNGSGTVNGLTNITWNPEAIVSGQAATEDQLKAVDAKATQAQATHTVVTAEGEVAEGEEYTDGNIQVNKQTSKDGQDTYDVKLNDKIILGDNIEIDGLENQISFACGLKIDGTNRVITGLSNTKFNIAGYTNYAGSGKAATEGQLYDAFDFLNTKIDGITINDVPGHESGGNGGSGSTGEAGGTTGGSGSTGSGVVTGSGNIVVTPVKGDNPTDSPKWNLDLNDEKITLGDDNNNVTIEGTKGNVTATGTISGTTITAGKSSMTDAGISYDGKTYISTDGLNANNQKITNVAAGEVSADSKDAVNGSQLYATNMAIENNAVNIQNLGSALTNLDDRVDKVGAGAAALAALHPLDFDPDAKWDFAAGYGNYRSASAAAIGAYYRPNEDTMFSVGGTFGNGENMVNAGVSFKLGSGSSHVTTSRVAMAKDIISLRNTVAQLTAMVNDLAGKRAVVADDAIDFPDVPENHWAYEYVKKLADMGVLTGYPDGTFKGNQTMTRYEFAAITYRALQNGVIVDRDMSKMLAEFKPELELIRVDTVARDKDGNPTIERVRVNK